jgi:beta-lactamase superfamily II metal-dependent hydrolase
VHPPLRAAGADEDDNGVVLKLALGGASFLLAADLTAKGETYLLNRDADLRATVLKVAHHGSAGSTSPDFLEAVQPLMGVVSAGRDNRFTCHRRDAGAVAAPVFTPTARDQTDGSRLWVETGGGQARADVSYVRASCGRRPVRWSLQFSWRGGAVPGMTGTGWWRGTNPLVRDGA